MKTPTFPVFTLCASAPIDLCEAYTEATEAVNEAISAMREAGPHPRDFQGGDLRSNYITACEEHLERCNALRAVMKELEALAIFCGTEHANREARRREREEHYRKAQAEREAEEAAGQLDDSDDDTAAENTSNSMKLEAIP